MQITLFSLLPSILSLIDTRRVFLLAIPWFVLWLCDSSAQEEERYVERKIWRAACHVLLLSGLEKNSGKPDKDELPPLKKKS